MYDSVVYFNVKRLHPVSDLIVFDERLPHVLHLLLQLCLVTITKLLSAHLLCRGESVKSLSEVKVMLFLQRFRRHVGQIPATHLRRQTKESLTSELYERGIS